MACSRPPSAELAANRIATPNPALLAILLPAYDPCPGFAGACTEMRWAPGEGHEPQGVSGALGRLDEVSLVLVTAGPGDPFALEAYPSSPPSAILAAASKYVYAARE